MTPYLIITCIILITLILIQVRDGGLNVTASSTLQAPVEKRGSTKTLHIATIVVGILFVILCIISI